MELIEYWNLLLRRKWIVLFFIVLGGALGVTYLHYASPVYEAQGKILLVEDRGGAASTLSSAGDMMLSSIGKRSDPLMTQIEIMRTRPIIQRAIDSLLLIDEDGLPLSVREIAPLFSFSVMPNTNIISISCRHGEPEVAASLVNTLAAIFIENNEYINRESATAAKAFIERQLITQKDQLDAAEATLLAYKKNIGAVSLEQETQLRIGGIAQLEAELIRVESSLMGAYAERTDVEQKITDPNARNSSLFPHWRSSLESINTRIASIEAQKKSLVSKLASRNRELSTLPEQELHYANLLRDQEIVRNIYVQMLEQYESYRIREAANVSTVRVIEPAITPERPIAPQKKKILMLALIAAAMAGFGVALLREYFDDSIHSVDDIPSILPYNILGAIPYMKKLTPLYAAEENSHAAEALRLVQTNLHFTGLLSSGKNMIMLTSSGPEEGKTTLSINLALSFTQMGKKTIVINLDLRRPTFDRILDIPMDKGVTDYLVGDTTIEDVVYRTKEGLNVIPAGTTPPNPSALMAGEKMRELLDIVKKSYEVVIFDTAPVTMVSETLAVAPAMDAIILVADMRNSSKRSISRLRGAIEGKNLPLAGVVINKVSAGKDSYYSNYVANVL